MSETKSSVHRQVWGMSGPIILANISVPLLGAVDTAVVGHLPEVYYIGAVAIGAMLFTYIHHLFNCLRMGTTGPTAQARGAGNYAEVRALIGRALLLAGAIGAALIILQLPIIAFAFWLIDASPQVEHYAREYFGIRIWSMPAALAGYAIIGWYYGLRDARTPLIVQVVANALNIGLDFLFVFGFGWGVPGVAIASVIASYAGLALGLWYVWRTLRALPGEGHGPLLDPAALARMLSINRDLVLRTFCVVSVLGLLMAKSAELGDLTLAGNQVLHNFLVFTSFGLDAFAHAAEAILGEAVGRRDRPAFQRAMQVVFIWAVIVGIANALIYAIAGHGIIALLTSITEVRAAAGEFLPWVVLLPLVALWAYTYDGVYLAATRTTVMRNTVIISFVAYIVLLYTLVPLYGNIGLWIALATFLGMRGLLLHLAYPTLLGSIGDEALKSTA
jgi:MATE family multidrug resistance protein